MSKLIKYTLITLGTILIIGMIASSIDNDSGNNNKQPATKSPPKTQNLAPKDDFTSSTSNNASSTAKSTNPQTPQQKEPYFEVTKIIDGDTIEVKINTQTEKIRMIGVDTPETLDPRKPVQCFGNEASAKTKELLLNKKVRLEIDTTQSDRDKYQRLLRYIYRDDGLFINKWLIQNGYAHEYTYNIPYKFQQEFKTAEKYARENSLGLWNINTCNNNTATSITTSSQLTLPTIPAIQAQTTQQNEQATQQQTTGHTWYTSSYHTATKYYCDTDPAWKKLSSKYLKSFLSSEELLKAYPDRTLNEECK